MTCDDCQSREGCKKLCDGPAKCANQDQIEWGESEPDSIYLFGQSLRVFNASTKDDSRLLTERQWQILNAKNMGFNSTEISKKLSISSITVRRHIQNALKKAFTVFTMYEGGI